MAASSPPRQRRSAASLVDISVKYPSHIPDITLTECGSGQRPETSRTSSCPLLQWDISPWDGVPAIEDFRPLADRTPDTIVSVGLTAPDGGSPTWPLLMSMLRAKEYLLTSEPIPAEQAVALGLANRVVPDVDLLDQALAVAQRIAKLPP